MNIHYGFVMNCMTSSESEINISLKRKLITKVNILGKEINQNDHQIFHIYDDGTVEKKIVIE